MEYGGLHSQGWEHAAPDVIESGLILTRKGHGSGHHALVSGHKPLPSVDVTSEI